MNLQVYLRVSCITLEMKYSEAQVEGVVIKQKAGTGDFTQSSNKWQTYFR